MEGLVVDADASPWAGCSCTSELAAAADGTTPRQQADSTGRGSLGEDNAAVVRGGAAAEPPAGEVSAGERLEFLRASLEAQLGTRRLRAAYHALLEGAAPSGPPLAVCEAQAVAGLLKCDQRFFSAS